LLFLTSLSLKIRMQTAFLDLACCSAFGCSGFYCVLQCIHEYDTDSANEGAAARGTAETSGRAGKDSL
jgi:hypothetical protein